MNGDAANDAHQNRCQYDAPEAAEAADHHDHEGSRDDLGAHCGVHDGDGRKQRAGERSHADAKHHDGGEVGPQPDAKRGDHVGPLDAGAHNAAECGLL